jgi:hypothetical protein
MSLIIMEHIHQVAVRWPNGIIARPISRLLYDEETGLILESWIHSEGRPEIPVAHNIYGVGGPQ